MTRRFPVALSLLLAFTIPAVAAGRQRAVRVAAPACTFALSSTAIVVPAQGVARTEVIVTPSSGPCTTWGAFSEADWIAIETGSGRAYITVAANTTTTPRSAILTIAGVAFDVTQEGDTVVVTPPVDPNVLRNATFDVDTAQWGWDPRFPNGSGNASWSNLDANGSTTSGSFKLRSTGYSPSFQQFQCAAVTGGRSWQWGGAVRLGATTGGAAAMVLVEYPTPDCSGEDYTLIRKTVRGESGWLRRSYSTSLKPGTQSVQFLVASGMTDGTAPFESWFDDLYLRLP